MADRTQPDDVFDRYLRLSTLQPGEWLAAVRFLSGSPELSLDTRAPPGFYGSLSWLDTEKGALAGLVWNRDARLSGMAPERLSVLMVLDGVVELTTGTPADAEQITPGQVVCLRPVEPFTVRITGPCRVLVALLPAEAGRGDGPVAELPSGIDAEMQACLDRSRFWQDHEQASADVSSTLARLRYALRTGASLPERNESEVAATEEPVDRRVIKALNWLRQQAGAEFDLNQLASASGLSTRNLYYLMKRHTGVTPYRFFQSVRLLNVRTALLNCPSDAPTVSWHALSEGFVHLGRFSALYLREFGEYPSDTLRWRETMARQAERVICESRSDVELRLTVQAPDQGLRLATDPQP